MVCAIIVGAVFGIDWRRGVSVSWMDRMVGVLRWVPRRETAVISLWL